jgi:hypothetical protein
VLAITFLRAVLGCVADYLSRASTASRKRAYARPYPREVYHLPSGTGLVKGVTVELDVVTHVPVEFTCYPPHAGICSYPY